MLESENWIKASPEKLAAFYLKCNEEQSFRTAFLERPVWLLREFDIEVGEDAAIEIKKTVEQLKTRYKTDITELPESWEMYGHELLDNGWGILVKTDSKKGAIP